MAKIAYVGLPAHGHTNPTLPIVKELISRGHELLYYNAEHFRPKVEPTGVRYCPFPEPMPTEREVSEAMHDFIHASLMMSSMSRPLARFLIDEFEHERPDLVIYDSAAMWGYIAARTHNIPNVCLITTFVLDGSQKEIGYGTMLRFIWSALPHVPELLRWRRSMAQEFGKENSGGITEYADLNLVLTSKAFHPKNSFIDDRFRFVGPSLDRSTRDGDFPFDQLSEGKKVYISLGTINNLAKNFYQTAFEAFTGFPAQFILSAGKSTDIASLGPVPENFIVRNYVPQLEILQKVDAFITHGGMNSVHEGLVYGVPEIVVPQQFEQLLNGKRVAQTGCGILLGDRRPYGRVSAEKLKQALQQIFDGPTYQQNAERIGKTLTNSGGYIKAVEEIKCFIS